MDEVGDLPAEVQISFLRVLQEREVEHVGSNKPIPVDVRVLAATHRDLERLVSGGKFRQDLLYRLNVVPIEVPSLRERAADIPLLTAGWGIQPGSPEFAIENHCEDCRSGGLPGSARTVMRVHATARMAMAAAHLFMASVYSASPRRRSEVRCGDR